MKDLFSLYSCCQLVKGAQRAAICDLQRNKIYPIPSSLYELFEDSRQINFATLIKEYQNDPSSLSILKEYASFLTDNELGLWGQQPVDFIDLPKETISENRIISNSIIDFGENTQHDLRKISQELTQLRCEYIELRYFDDSDNSLDKIIKDVSCFDNSSIRGLEILKRADKNLSPLEEFNYLKDICFRLTKLVIYGASENKVIATSDYSVILTQEIIRNEQACGCVDEFYCIAETSLFIESLHYNNCLNRKISIDKDGNIKNCPSMQKAYGNLSSGSSLVKTAQSIEFQSIWHIKKDDIEICKDCELRYVCQDCRAYISNESNIYSKPLKCSYDPYKI